MRDEVRRLKWKLSWTIWFKMSGLLVFLICNKTQCSSVFYLQRYSWQELWDHYCESRGTWKLQGTSSYLNIFSSFLLTSPLFVLIWGFIWDFWGKVHHMLNADGVSRWQVADINLTCMYFAGQESVLMQFCGNKLDKKDFFGKSDPFLVFYRSNEDGT